MARHALRQTQAEAGARDYLRAATRADHQVVDEAFGAFDLSSLAGYARFLRAQARVLPLAERLLRPDALIAGWHGRTGALLGDLCDLGLDRPTPCPLAVPRGEAARWGALYVLEGSRMGGAVLARSVPDGLPARFLNARHGPGDWARLIDALDAADTGMAWRAQAVDGARALFGAFCNAARA